MRPLYYFGRILQVISLLAMPSAIWVGEFRHSERGAILIFGGSIAVFYFGWFFASVHKT